MGAREPRRGYNENRFWAVAQQSQLLRVNRLSVKRACESIVLLRPATREAAGVAKLYSCVSVSAAIQEFNANSNLLLLNVVFFTLNYEN